MFGYFPGNYIWNLSVVAGPNSGGYIDEIDRACRPLREAAMRGEDAGTEEFLAAGSGLVNQLETQAEELEAAGRYRSAGQTYARATNYLVNAERIQSAGSAGRLQTYKRCLNFMERSFQLADPLTTRFAVPVRALRCPLTAPRPPRPTERLPRP